MTELTPTEALKVARFGIHAPEVLSSLDFDPEEESR